MTMRFPLSLSLLVAAICAAPASAAAQEPEPVLVVQFTGEVPPALEGAPERLSELLADIVRQTGAEVTVAPRGDVLTLAGCAEPSDDCLRQALGMLLVRAVLLGEVSPRGEGGVEVELRLIATDEESRSRTVIVEGDSAEALEPGFRAEAEAFLRGQPSPGEQARAAAAVEPEAGAEAGGGADLTGTAAPAQGAGGFSAGRVEPYAWGVAGGGAGMMLVGGLLLLAADGVQGDVDSAPTETVADLEALVDLEAKGRRYARWGSTFLVVGAVATAVGAVLVVRQGRSREESTITVAPSVTGDSVGLTLTVGGGR